MTDHQHGFKDSRNRSHLTVTITVNFILLSPSKAEPTKNFLESRNGTEVDECTAELYSKLGNTGTTSLIIIIIEMTQCDFKKKHDAKRKVFLHMWINSARATSRKEGNVDRNDKTSNESLQWFAVAAQNTKPPSIVAQKALTKPFEKDGKGRRLP